MLEFKAPVKFEKLKKPTIFLAGSIEMGKAENWQEEAKKLLSDQDVIILNPRRDNWDNSWIQSINNPKFKEQVDWEQNALELSDYILMYFDPSTKSPISLLEFGEFAKTEKLFVVCPDGFWKKGNIDVVCEEFGIQTYPTLKQAIKKIINKIKNRTN